MRILFFSNSHQWGYEDRLLYNLLMALNRAQYDLILICPEQASIVAKLANTNIKIHPIPYAYGHGLFLWKQVYSVWALIKQHRPDVFHLVGRESMYPWSLLLGRRPEIAYFVSLWSSSITNTHIVPISFWQRPLMARVDGVLVAHRDDEDFASQQLKIPKRKIFPFLPMWSTESSVGRATAVPAPEVGHTIGLYIPRELMDEVQAREALLRIIALVGEMAFSLKIFIDQNIAGSYFTDGLSKLIQKHSIQSLGNRISLVGFDGVVAPFEQVGIWLSLFAPKHGPDLQALEAWRRQLTVIAPRRDGAMVYYSDLQQSERFHTYQLWDMRELRQILEHVTQPAENNGVGDKTWSEQTRFLQDSGSLMNLLERYRRSVAKRGRYIGRLSGQRPSAQ